MKPDQRVLQELARRIVDAVHPLRIILFGSAARGEMGPNSDLDTLVIMPDGSHRGKTAQEIYRHLWGLGFAKDIVVVTESDIREHATNSSLVIKEALETGKELYDTTSSVGIVQVEKHHLRLEAGLSSPLACRYGAGS